MRRVLATALAILLLVLIFPSCSSEENRDDGKLKVITTVFPEYDFARVIGGDKVSVSMLTSGDIHSFEPSLVDVNKISSADVFIYVGGASFAWVDGILDRIKSPDLIVVNLFDSVEKLCSGSGGLIIEPDKHKDEHESSHEGESDLHFDEHIWTSPKNASMMCDAICDALVKADPDNKSYYESNCLEYGSELDKLDSLYKEVVSEAERKTIVVADRFPFVYMCNEYNLSYCAAMTGCSSASDISFATVVSLANAIKENGIKTVIYTDFSDSNIIDTVEKQLGDYKIKRKMLNSCQTVREKDIKNGVTYLSLMTENAEVLREVLN